MEPVLPLEILIHIAIQSVETFRDMLALRPVAEFLKYHRKYILDTFARIVITSDATEYYIGRIWHREDGPAVEYNNGSKMWCRGDKRHRGNDLPALECVNGSKFWYQRGKVHRDNDLPAIEYANGNKEWWRHGKLHRDNDLPAVMRFKDKEWRRNGELHRDNNLPAIIRANGNEEWWVEGVRHRDNGPAIVLSRGIRRHIWFQNGKHIPEPPKQPKMKSYTNLYRNY